MIKFRFTIRWLLVFTALVAILTLRHKIVSDRERVFEKLTEDGVSLFHSWQKPFLHTVMVYDNVNIKGAWVDASAQITKMAFENPNPLVPPVQPAPPSSTLAWMLGPATPKPHTIRMPLSAIDAEMIDIIGQLPEMENLLLDNYPSQIRFETQLKRLEEIRLHLPELNVRMASLPRKFAE